MDINQLDTSQNIPNDGGSYFNENQEVKHNSQCTNNEFPIYFNSMLLESYDSPQNIEMGDQVNKEFFFLFNQESDPKPIEMFAFQNDNQNTYNL